MGKKSQLSARLFKYSTTNPVVMKMSVIKHLVVNYDKKLINTIITTFGKNRSTFRLDRIA